MRDVQWSDYALDDLEEQVLYIGKDDPAAARRVMKRIRETGNKLSDFATGHPGRVAGTYEKSVPRLPHILTYALSGDGTVLTILRVIHTSRDWQADGWPE